MKKLILSCLTLAVIACNQGDKKNEGKNEVKETAASTSPTNWSGYSATYSSNFTMGDPKNSEALLAVWKAFDDGNLAGSKSYMADSLFIYTADGNAITGTRDSVLAHVQQYRDMFSAVKSTVHAIFPAHSVDKNEDWVLIWGTEVDTDKKTGKVDSVNLQETWRMKNGKFDLLYQHMRPAGPPPAK